MPRFRGVGCRARGLHSPRGVLIVDASSVPSPVRPWHKPGRHVSGSAGASSTLDCGALRRLIADVARLSRDWESCADLVVDGYPRNGLRQGMVITTVRVWFSEWQSADDCVVAQSHGYPPGDLFVATSDRALARRVWMLGAQVVSRVSGLQTKLG
jgi:hypothetical protein